MEPLADPILVSPRQAQGVVADHFHLDWEPVAGADFYAVEIASDASFEDVVVRVDETRASEVTLSGLLQPDHALYYWRVIAHASGATSPGEHVESFLAVTSDEVATARVEGVEGVGDREDLGPAAALVSSAATTALDEAAGRPDTAWADELTSEGVEPEGMASGQILGIAIAVLVSLFVISGLVVSWKTVVAAAALEAASSTELNPNVPRYPVRAAAESDAQKALTSYEPVAGQPGIYRIPVDQVIQMMANRTAAQPDSAAAQLAADLGL